MDKKKYLDSRYELVEELKKFPRSPEIDEIISEAKAGEYHDYKNKKYVCGKMEASRKLRAAGLIELAKRIENGDFDEKADEDDKQHLRETLNQHGMGSPAYKKIFGLEEERKLPYDPHLKSAMKEIETILTKYDAVASILLVSPTHSEFLFHLNASWSIARLEEGPRGQFGIRIRSKKEDFPSKEVQHQCTEATVHGFTSMLQFGSMTQKSMQEILTVLKEKMQIVYKVWGDKPDDAK